jgi:hypothetical protein
VKKVKDLIGTFKRNVINEIIERSARVELVDNPRMPFVGTGWVIERKKAKPSSSPTGMWQWSSRRPMGEDRIDFGPRQTYSCFSPR